MRRIRHLLLATVEDTADPLSWSGIPYSLRQALQPRLERLTILDNLPVRRSLPHGLLRLALGGTPPRWPLWATPPALKHFGRALRQAIELHKPDAVLSISSQCLIYCRTSVPVVMFSDAPWIAWKRSYQEYERIPWNGQAFARKEAQAAARCSALAFASQWAVDAGKSLYQLPGSRFSVAPLGATWTPEFSADALEQRIKARGWSELRLLFVGKDWERKGGPLAAEVTRRLNESGVPAFLDVVGCNPEIAEESRKFVRVRGVLNRNDPEQAKRLHELFLNSHFLLVPTDAECFGIVFAEAAAHGLPAVSRAVDAVPSIVIDDATGILVDRDAGAGVYVSRIKSVFEDRLRYLRMGQAAHQRFTENFTWDICAQRILAALEERL